MKQTILGILVVFCLQLGFIVYSAVERSMDALVAVNEIPTASVTNAEVPETGEPLDFLDTNGNARHVVTWSAARMNKRQSATRRSSNKNLADPDSRAVNFEPVVIAYQKLPAVEFRTEYPQTVPPPSERANYQLSAKAIPQAEKKRSFLSKSVAVLKKPYDWLKALGSK